MQILTRHPVTNALNHLRRCPSCRTADISVYSYADESAADAYRCNACGQRFQQPWIAAEHDADSQAGGHPYVTDPNTDPNATGPCEDCGRERQSHSVAPGVGVMSREEAVDRIVRMRERLRDRASDGYGAGRIRSAVRDQRTIVDPSLAAAATAKIEAGYALDVEALTLALIYMHLPTGGAQ